MGIRQQDICNRVMAQAQGIAESDFPIDAFPAKVQCVILGMVRHENFKVEYLAAAIIIAKFICTDCKIQMCIFS